MTGTVVSRFGQAVLVLVGVSVVVFVTMHVLPGDVAQLLLGDHATAAQIAGLRRQLGLDQPLWVQCADFAGQALRGDLGTSIRSNRPALADVWDAFPVTLQLTVAALAIGTAVGIPAGVIASLRPGGGWDNAIMAGTLFGISMPIFWLGLMLLLLFGALLGWLPIGGTMPVGLDAPAITGMTVLDSLLSGRWDLVQASLRHLALPAATLAAVPVATITRITRGAMLAAALQDHVRTARAKGVRELVVVIRHVLRNAMIPVVTVLGLQLGLLLSGAVLTETIYALPGLGRLMVDSILSRDYPVVQAAALFTSLLFVLVNLAVDLAYGLLDPRIRVR
ncbi:MAG: ABC transporter permease [Acidisphaera sp.]|nr:ABC transporter permease [Acidisphaera sp.]